jgi:hypothetical protein
MLPQAKKAATGKNLPPISVRGIPLSVEGTDKLLFPPWGGEAGGKGGGQVGAHSSWSSAPGGDGNKGQTNYPPANERKRDRQIIAPCKRKAGSADSRLAARSPPRAGCCRRPSRQQLGKTCPLFLSPGSPCPSKGQTNYHFPPWGGEAGGKGGGQVGAHSSWSSAPRGGRE